MAAALPENPGSLTALSDDLAGAVQHAGRSAVAIHARRRIPSSGVHWRPGVVVTADHTLKRDEGIRVSLDGGETVDAELAGRDPGTDLAVLRLAGGDAAVAEPADAASLAVGRLVLAVGRPGADVTASFGIVSAVGGEWRTPAGGRIDRLVRLDLSILDGFSGGALVDAGGRVLGINSSALARGTPVAIPASVVDRVTDQLLERGHVRRGYLGVAMHPVRLPEAVGQALDPPSGAGLMLVGVEPGGPAERAGLLMGDVLIALDDTPVSDPAEVLAALGAEPVGQTLRALVIRAGERTTVTIPVGERPAYGGRG